MNGTHTRLLEATLALALLGGCAGASVSVSSEDYAVPYDYNEFRAATDGKDFPVEIAGNPFPDLIANDVARRLLVPMQANKPRPRLTFVLGRQAAYRLVLVFDPASGLGANSVCKGDTRSGVHVAGKVVVFAVYCRNDLPMSQVIGRTAASSPEDPAVGRLFRDVFQTLFTDSLTSQPNPGYPGGLQ